MALRHLGWQVKRKLDRLGINGGTKLKATSTGAKILGTVTCDASASEPLKFGTVGTYAVYDSVGYITVKDSSGNSKKLLVVEEGEEP